MATENERPKKTRSPQAKRGKKTAPPATSQSTDAVVAEVLRQQQAAAATGADANQSGVGKLGAAVGGIAQRGADAADSLAGATADQLNKPGLGERLAELVRRKRAELYRELRKKYTAAGTAINAATDGRLASETAASRAALDEAAGRAGATVKEGAKDAVVKGATGAIGAATGTLNAVADPKGTGERVVNAVTGAVETVRDKVDEVRGRIVDDQNEPWRKRNIRRDIRNVVGPAATATAASEAPKNWRENATSQLKRLFGGSKGGGGGKPPGGKPPGVIRRTASGIRKTASLGYRSLPGLALATVAAGDAVSKEADKAGGSILGGVAGATRSGLRALRDDAASRAQGVQEFASNPVKGMFNAVRDFPVNMARSGADTAYGTAGLINNAANFVFGHGLRTLAPDSVKNANILTPEFARTVPGQPVPGSTMSYTNLVDPSSSPTTSQAQMPLPVSESGRGAQTGRAFTPAQQPDAPGSTDLRSLAQRMGREAPIPSDLERGTGFIKSAKGVTTLSPQGTRTFPASAQDAQGDVPRGLRQVQVSNALPRGSDPMASYLVNQNRLAQANRQVDEENTAASTASENAFDLVKEQLKRVPTTAENSAEARAQQEQRQKVFADLENPETAAATRMNVFYSGYQGDQNMASIADIVALNDLIDVSKGERGPWDKIFGPVFNGRASLSNYIWTDTGIYEKDPKASDGKGAHVVNVSFELLHTLPQDSQEWLRNNLEGTPAG